MILKDRIHFFYIELVPKWYQEYKASLKDTAVEEMIDLVLFRPLAFIIVKMIYRLPVTPNQLSFLSMLTGIASGVMFAFGDTTSFIYAGILFGLAHILDCCDGMIARLKGNGTPIGRIIDGWVDYTTSTAVYIGLLIGLHNGDFHLAVNPWLLMVPAAFSLAIHAMIVDYYRHEFLAHALGKANSIRDDKKLFSDELHRMKKSKGRYMQKLMIIFYLGYTKLQIKRNTDRKQFVQERYYTANKPLLLMWNWIGPSTHIFVLILAALFYEPRIFFVYILVLANLWMLLVLIIQVRVNKGIEIRKSS